MLPVVALVALGGVGSEVGPAWQAKSGGGTPGTFTAGYETCGRRACTWYGDFAPGDGSPVRRDVILYDAPDELVRGGSAPARDTGARSGVFGASGGGFWVAATLFAAVGVAAALAWLVLLARAVRRRRALSGPGR
ncbi:hypothetical protein [Micromonospora mirobrigensis]|uniref:hypothetical protein n=1 Tax=Micromonospora mirobrigensis TaxID=262898 RepID=UPI00159EFD98|nr:hypothetical protein [Micromonospora mirobrigensis]